MVSSPQKEMVSPISKRKSLILTNEGDNAY